MRARRFSRRMRTSTLRSRCCSAGSSPASTSAAARSPPARSFSRRLRCSRSRARSAKAPRRSPSRSRRTSASRRPASRRCPPCRGSPTCTAWPAEPRPGPGPDTRPSRLRDGLATVDSVTTFSLRNVRLRTGEQHHETVEVHLEPLLLGGQEYAPVPADVPAELTITKATTGSVYQLAFRATLHGPCFRCLRDTVLEQSVDAREYQATNPAGDEELDSPYVTD